MSNLFLNVPPDRSIARIRYELRLRRLEVVTVAQITPHLVRIVFGGALGDFASQGFDDHVKLFIPAPGESFDEVPALGPNGPVFDESRPKPAMRDYTPHDYNPETGTVQFDFAIHDSGPATSWALRARPGDPIIVGGPRGSFVVGSGFDWHLLIGDDTALPAIRRRLAELPAGAHAVVFAEVDGPADEEPFKSAASAEIHWVHRTQTRLLDAVAAAAFPSGSCYAWIACESTEAKALRSALLERGFDRRTLKASGYWRRGATAIHDLHDQA